MEKFIQVEILNSDRNAEAVKSLVEEFAKAGRIEITGKAMSLMTYAVSGRLTSADAVTSDDLEHFRKLGAEARFVP